MANNAAAFQPGQMPGAEPSMEEILASIRRIIADDNLGTTKDETPTKLTSPGIAPADASPPSPEPGSETDADVLDLAGFSPPSEPVDEDVMIGVAEGEMIGEAGIAVVDPMPPFHNPAPAPVMMAPSAPLKDAGAMAEHILSRETGGLVANAFASLARNTPMPAPGRSLEDVVTEMLRPMLRDWMDSHLPAIVERLVRNEIERVARGG